MSQILHDRRARSGQGKVATFTSGIAAIVLLTAAALKWWGLPLLSQGNSGPLGLPQVAIGIIAFEAAFGIWLVIGPWPPRIAWVPSGCFTLFAGIALYFAVQGEASCGCFGRVKVNPWLTFSADLVLAGALFAFRPPPQGLIGGLIAGHAGLRLGITGVVAAGAVMLSVWQLPIASASDLEVGMIRSGNRTMLEPAQWLGKRWPLLAHLNEPSRVEVGRWLVVLHSAHCSTCLRALPGFEALAWEGVKAGDVFQVAFVEMPSHETATHSDAPVFHCRLSPQREWFATTPVAMLLDDCVVRDVVEGEAAVGIQPDWQRMKFVRAD